MQSKINFVQYGWWNNSVEVVGESDKAVKLKVVAEFAGDENFVGNIGRQAWFPKSALKLRDNGETAELKKWFRSKMNDAQERVFGMLS